MPEFSNAVLALFHFKREVAQQGGLLNGKDPTAFNSADPLRLWIIQVGIIIFTTQLLSLVLRKIRQPRVISEVIGGIILGPSVCGRIPNFTKHIFPTESRPFLSLVANIGLCLFLFLVGLEIDGSIIKRNVRLSFSVAVAGMVVPFGLGSAISVAIYHQFVDHAVAFTHFMLFTGVAFSITAFPVLCRILTELKLLDTTVGVVVLSAGVGNDIIGWTLLALSIALVNAGSGLTALYILLACVGWTLFLLFVVKRPFRWLARRTGSIENGPTVHFMTATILLLFGSAFFTDVIGVHAIFGAFLAGIIVPREGGLAIALTEKLEDMVSIIFLPLYFTLSGLSTDLGLLNNGITWGYTAAICFLAFVSKFGACSIAARTVGFSAREASAIGSLMSCKGLVELIVLNVGLSAGILSPRVFSMFVLEALALTCLTTPLVTTLYPQQYHTRASAISANFKNVPGAEYGKSDKDRSPESHITPEIEKATQKLRFTVVLDKIEHAPGTMAFMNLILLPSANSDTGGGPAAMPRKVKGESGRRYVDGVRLIELSDKFSAVMKSSVADALLHTDPLLAIFRMFAELNDLQVSTTLSIIPYDEFAPAVVAYSDETQSDLILISWPSPVLPLTGTDGHDSHPQSPTVSRTIPRSYNPFESLFRPAHHQVDNPISANNCHFVRGVFSQSKTDVALWIDRGRGGLTSVGNLQHIYLPFFGGPDDRVALEFVVQLCQNPKITATVVRVMKGPESEASEPPVAHTADYGSIQDPNHDITSITGVYDTVYDPTTHTRLQSQTADNITWERYASRSSSDGASAATEVALTRIEFAQLTSSVPLHVITQAVISKTESLALMKTNLLVFVGRSRRLAVEDHHRELRQLMEDHGHVSSEVKKTIGDVATAFLARGCDAGLVVLQAANTALE